MAILCPGCMTELAPDATQCPICLRQRSRQEVFRGIREEQLAAERRRKRPFYIAGGVLLLGGLGYFAATGKLKLPAPTPAAAPVSESAPVAEPSPVAAPKPVEAPVPAPAPVEPPASAPEAPVSPKYTLTRKAAEKKWTITGRVYDLLTLEPVAGAAVSLENPATGKKWLAKTGKDGRYSVLLPPREGGYAIDVRHKDYRKGFLDEATPPYSEQSEARRIEAGRLLRESVIMHVPVAPESGDDSVEVDAVLAPLPR